MKNDGSSSNTTIDESVVVDYGMRRSSCGYCKSPHRTSISHGLWARSLTVGDYQALLDRGWRRSGCFLYKPLMERTCCPSYTIRLKATDFVASKEQLRVSRRLQRFLDGTLDNKGVNTLEDPNSSKKAESFVHHKLSNLTSEELLSASSEEQNEVEKSLHDLSDKIDKVANMFTEKGNFPSGIQLPKALVRKVTQDKKKLLGNRSEDLLYSSNIAFQIAASIKRAQSGNKDGSNSKPSRDCETENVSSPKYIAEKLASSKDGSNSKPSRDCETENESSPKYIAEKLASSLDQIVKKCGLSIRACNGHINFHSSSKQVSPSASVQNVTEPKISGTKDGVGGKHLISPQHCRVKRRALEIRLSRSSFDPEEFALFRRYQLKVHNDKLDRVTEDSYRRFLVDTPLLHVSPTGDSTVPPCGFGSFHQQYLIDGQLVAVGVVDILPNCMSSKYLFWDPDFAFLSLGKYSALQEIDWVKENQAYCPSLQYYYLGYYIHSCNKMKYKAAYRPSELLCPLRYQWVPFDIARPLLDKKPYVILSDYSILQNVESSLPQITDDVMEGQLDDIGQEHVNDYPRDEDEERVELESSDDDTGLETTSYGKPENGDISKILLGLEGNVRYKNLQNALDPEQRNYLETQLQKYMRVVGPELAERMVYSLE